MSDRKTWEIRDANGRLFAYHIRTDNPDGTKSVVWKRPSGEWGLNGTPLSEAPLYGAEMVSDLGDDELTVVAEGEKARDALEAAGIPAVGTVTGASGTPGPEALEILRNRRVCLWPDNDETGQKHMNRIGELLEPIAAEVLTYTWDEAPEKGDAADHPAVISKNAKAVDRLLTDLEGAPRFRSAGLKGGVPAKSKIKFRTAREMAELAPPETEWIAKPWVAKGAITEIDGKIKAAGKTTFTSHLIKSIVMGTRFMEEPTTRGPVLMLTEQAPTSFRKVLERAGLDDCDDLMVLAWSEIAGMPWPEVAALAADKAVEIAASTMVVDTLGQFASIRGDAENSAGAAQEAMEPLMQAAARGLAVIVTRHERKGGGEVGDSARGSSAFGGAVDVILSLRRAEGNGRPSVRVLESLSRFEETPEKIMIELTPQGYKYLGDATAVAEEEATKALLKLLPSNEAGALTMAEITEELKKHSVKRTTTQTVLYRLMDVGSVTRIGGGKRGDPYRHFRSAETPAPSGRTKMGEGQGELESPVPEEEMFPAETPTYGAAERIDDDGTVWFDE